MPDPDDETFLAPAKSGTKNAPAAAGPRRRKSSEQRAADIVAAAAEHFAEVGFGGSTRDIAKRVGVTQPLLYRYFPTKDDLIEAVYQTVYLEQWDENWDKGLKDRSIPVRARFEAFYADYARTTFTPTWLRLSYYAGLRGADINQWYNHLVEELILKQLVREHRVELGHPDETYVAPAELEPAWQMHGGLLHHGWRKHVLNLRVAPDINVVIADALDMYFAVAENVYARHACNSVPDTDHEQN